MQSGHFSNAKSGMKLLGKCAWMSGAIIAAFFISVAKGDEPMKEMPRRNVFMARGAGRWYPGGKAALESMVSNFIAQARPPAVDGRPVAGLCPHAGYQYSGRVAGYVFKALQESFRKRAAPEAFVILGFSHGGGFRGVALMDADALATPVGPVPIDRDLTAELAGSGDSIFFDNSPHEVEHSAENLVPFVQVAFPGMPIVVAIIGDHDLKTVNGLAAALNEAAGRKRLVALASTDMLHDPDYELVAKTDKNTLEKVRSMDISGLRDSWSPQHQLFCGIMPVLTAMTFAGKQGCKAGSVLFYRNSGDDYPESRGQWVVGYGAVLFAAPDK